MADGEVLINTKIDTQGAEKGAKDLNKGLSSLIKSGGALGGVLTGVTMGLKASTKVIKETTAAINTQIKAEKQLEVAASNNPYLDKKSVQELKNYASQLQSISTVGDEQILPLMSQLASAGRTQEEIQSILSAALDVSASGMMSLDGAVTQLNATFSGNVGQMGRQITELKDLTAEELKNGKAVDIIAQKYKGIAEETTAATGSFEQMKNAQGDFNESVGKLTKPTSDLWNKFWKGWYERGIENVEKINKWLDTNVTGKNLAKNLEQNYSEVVKSGGTAWVRYIRDTMGSLTDENIENLANYYNGQKKLNSEQQFLLEKIEAEKTRREEVAALQKSADEASAKRREEAAKREEEINAKKTFIQENESALNKELDRIKLEAELKGEEADAQDILNAYIQSYVDLVTSGVAVDSKYQEKRLKQVQEYAESLKEVNVDTKELEESIQAFLNPEGESKLSETIQATIDQLTEERNALDENSEAWKAYTDKIAELEGLKTDVIAKEEEAAKQTAIENAAALVENIATYINQFSDIVNSITDIAKSNNEAQTNDALTSLSEQYNDGLIDYETYCEKKGEINKKAALEEYKINMWAWNASLLTAAANIATGVASCLAEQGIPTALKYVNMALVAASGAAQVASIIANKPQRPSFYAGGIVGGINGTSYGADNTVINARKGEMILNANQQSKLWSMLNSGSSGGVSLNVDVVNNMGDSANVNTQLTSDGLRVTIDRIVESSLQKGRYNASLQTAENQRKGVNYL